MYLKAVGIEKAVAAAATRPEIGRGRCPPTVPNGSAKGDYDMTLNEWLRAIAGFFVLLSVVLGHVDQRFFCVHGFVGPEPPPVGLHAAGAR